MLLKPTLFQNGDEFTRTSLIPQLRIQKYICLLRAEQSAMNKSALAVKLKTCTREKFGSNLGGKSNILGPLVDFIIPLGKCRESTLN